MKHLYIIIFVVFFFSCGSKKMQTQALNCNLKNINSDDFENLFFKNHILNRLEQINDGILIYNMDDGMSNPKIIELKMVNNNFVTNLPKTSKVQQEFLINGLPLYFSKIDDNNSTENYLSQCNSNSTHQSLLVFFVKKKNKRLDTIQHQKNKKTHTHTQPKNSTQASNLPGTASNATLPQR